jgi:peroxiredoxin
MAIFSLNTSAQEVKIVQGSKETVALITDESLDMESTTLLKVGTFVPDFSLTNSDGRKFQLSDFKGKTVFINFFTLSCPSCMKELPIIEKEIWTKYKDNKDIEILIVGREEKLEKLIEFRDKKQFTFPIISDIDRKVYTIFASKYVPRNIIINKEGKLVFTEVGFTDDKFKLLLQKIESEIKN